ncbi:MAG: aminotransferase class I/II-fold pyridoxal phosphate-dependent enzyme [Gammaproteobacteria bacterium]|jgi:8-amino-7-oxononanoate synthase|nr:MAG: aminotransferase class I/II-fold pyridoxal phosphate-dependent enzyme [Gammaproteobacteria bacterium]
MSLLEKLEAAQRSQDVLKALGVNAIGATIDVAGSATEGEIAGNRVVLAGTNNYLGLTFDQACVDAAVAAVRSHGTGTTGSRLANGTYACHAALEDELNAFLGARSSIVFTTGYVANVGTISTLAGPGDVIVLDADSHASIYEGAKLSGAEVYRFRHNDPDDLAKRLRRLGERASRTLVIVEGLYSMLGDVSPLKKICEVKDRYGAYLLLDDAHSFGTMGANGRGLAEAQGCEDEVDFITGTFSKSLGSVGGYCASRKHDINPLRAQIRAYMFTASSTPSVIASTRAALQLIGRRPELRTRLWQNAKRVHSALGSLGFTLGADFSPVIATIMDSPQQAASAWQMLLDAGVYVNLVVPPGAPKNLSILRCSLSAAHTPDQINQIISAYALVADQLMDRPKAVAGGSI